MSSSTLTYTQSSRKQDGDKEKEGKQPMDMALAIFIASLVVSAAVLTHSLLRAEKQ